MQHMQSQIIIKRSNEQNSVESGDNNFREKELVSSAVRDVPCAIRPKKNDSRISTMMQLSNANWRHSNKTVNIDSVLERA